jgi:DMSO/TMAO reductase YedYZ molybdopterin-dependent catalytic subunit
MVEHPLSLTLDELLSLPSREIDAVLMCVHNPVGGPFVGNARWQGVLLRDLLVRAGAATEADHVRLHSVDGFSAGISLSLLEDGFEPMLVYAMNSTPLTRAHGAPVRVLVPGIHGYDANIKWLASVEVMRFSEAIDYAERKGWPRRPSRMAPNSRIDVPKPLSAGTRPPDRRRCGVESSARRREGRTAIDGGPWQVCALATAPARVLGSVAAPWDATPGRHTLRPAPGDEKAFRPNSLRTPRRGPRLPPHCG